MKEYKSVTIRIGYRTRKTVQEKIQEALDEYSQKGYTLNTLRNTLNMVILIFEREKQ